MMDMDAISKVQSDGDAAAIREALAQIREMRAQVREMRAQVREMHERNQLLLHSGEVVVCPECGKSNVIKDSIKCVACGRTLL